MADLLKWGSDWLEDQRKTHLSRSITYRRGAASVSVAATVGRTLFRNEDVDGFIQTERARDYLITAADLVLDGVAVLPRAGDEIVETLADDEVVYMVAAMNNEPPYRWSDNNRTTLRIHTREAG